MADEYPPIEPLKFKPRDPNRPRPSESEIDREIAAIDGVNGSAGHHLADPALRELLRKQIAGDITAEQFSRLGMEHLRQRGNP